MNRPTRVLYALSRELAYAIRDANPGALLGTFAHEPGYSVFAEFELVIPPHLRGQLEPFHYEAPPSVRLGLQ